MDNQVKTLDNINKGKNKEGLFTRTYAKPPWFDQELFDDGRQFFEKYRFGCVKSMLNSLIMGMSFDPLLSVLVYTGQSGTGLKSFSRYVATLLHVVNWFTTDIFDPNSAGYKSLTTVRLLHLSTAERITKEKGEPEDRKWISQRDLAYTIVGFAGLMIIAPRSFGCTDTSEIRGYVHYWRVLGYLHGIEDDVNPFAGSVEDAQLNSSMVFAQLVPALESPPADYALISKAVGDWAGPRNAFISYGLYLMIHNFSDTTKKTLGISDGRLELLRDQYPLASFGQKFRFYMIRLYNFFYAFALFRFLINKFFDFAVSRLSLVSNSKTECPFLGSRSPKAVESPVKEESDSKDEPIHSRVESEEAPFKEAA